MTSSDVSALTSPWPADAGYFRSGNTPVRLIPATRRYACCATPGCHESIFTDGGQWRHARNLSNQCPSGAGWADAFDVEDVEAQLEQMEEKHADELQEAAETAADAAAEPAFEEGRAEGLDEGHEAGRKEMHAEIDEALQGALAAIDTRGNGQTTIDTVREALASAWNRCAP